MKNEGRRSLILRRTFVRDHGRIHPIPWFETD